MSLLPTTRINSLASGTISNGAAEPGLAGQDEDILLVDFQPVVVSSGQLLSSPSTTASTSIYPLVPPPAGGQIPGAHMMGLNHHPSVSSDGITSPISATGSSGKTHNSNPNNNYSLVNLSNQAHHNNNTSRDESDMSYHPNSHIPPTSTTMTSSGPVTQINLSYDDENDEFARHQALAQPSLMKKRSRRLVSRDSRKYNHIWDNTNQVGIHQQPHQAHLSSSLSSSEDSDTGFLMGTRKTAFARRSMHRAVDPLPNNHVGGAITGGNDSPSATTGLLPLGNRKRVRRKRPSARNRKPVNNQRQKMPNPSDLLSFCCCLCEDDHPTHSNHRSTNGSSLRYRYFRLTCFIVIIIVVAILTSVTVSLQRKVDSLDWSLKRLDQAVGSPLSSDSSNGGGSNVLKPSESIDALSAAHNILNATVTNLKAQVEQALFKVQDLQKQVNMAAAKPDGVVEVRGDLAKLGSRVQDITATITRVQSSLDELKKENTKNSNSPDGSASSDVKSTNPPSSSSL